MKQRIYSLLFVVVATLFLVSPTQAQSQTDIIDRLDATLGVSLPSEYKANIRGNEKMQMVIKSKIGSEYTEEFIKEQMNSSWGINNQNQLIFVWSAVYKQITDEDLYDGSDGDDSRLDDFAEVVDRWEACGNKYAEGFNKYMEQKSAEAKQRSAEAQKRSAETDSMSLVNNLKKISESLEKLSSSIEKYSTMIDEDHLGKEAIEVLSDFKNKKTALGERAIKLKSQMNNKQNHTSSEIDSLLNISKKLLSDISNLRSEVADRRATKITYSRLENLVKFYSLYKKDPKTIYPDEIAYMRNSAKEIVQDCKEYNIDYKKELTPEMLKFYGIE